jgi:hypothetical protein
LTAKLRKCAQRAAKAERLNYLASAMVCNGSPKSLFSIDNIRIYTSSTDNSGAVQSDESEGSMVLSFGHAVAQKTI